MSIGADLIRGHTEAIILSLLREKNSYGYEINKTISQVSGGRYELKEATLYTAFKRLEDAGYITSYWGEQGAGARRKYYAITARGADAYCRMAEEWAEAREIIDQLLERGMNDHA